MTVMSSTSALHDLTEALMRPPRSEAEVGSWRWAVRQRMSGVRDLLAGETLTPDDGWLAPRRGLAIRERNALLARLSALGPEVIETPDVEPVREQLLRLVGDVRHHLQRRNDLEWDAVVQEYGGSE